MSLRIPLALLALLLCTPNLRAQPRVVPPPRNDRALEALASQIEPDLQGKVERLPQYVEFFRSKLCNDTRLFAFKIDATVDAQGRAQLSGYVEFPQTHRGLVGFLQALGFEVNTDKLAMLPDESLGDKRFGLVKTSHTLAYSSPNEPRSEETDCLLGEPLYLLREEGDHLLVHSGEGYLGYVASADIHRVNAKAFDLYPTENCVRILKDHRLQSGLVVPAGALLKRIPGGNGQLHCALPTGETVMIPSEVCEVCEPPAASIERAIGSAEKLLGTPYHWGGKTSAGIDCSGLVQIAFKTSGVLLPRDSNQQFLLGKLVATRWHRSQLRRGDTLYFLGTNGRIRHTAIYLGNDRYLQAEMPAVDIRSFNPDHDDYDPRRVKSFAFAKRLWE